MIGNEFLTGLIAFLVGYVLGSIPAAYLFTRWAIGKVTARLQKLYADVILGNNPKYAGWCTPVYKR